MRKIHQNITEKFPVQAWKVTEHAFSKETNRNHETVFSIGNGYLGMRGFFEEGFYAEPNATESTTMINGFYEYFDYHYIWRRPGFPPRYHCILNQINPVQVAFFADGEKISLAGNVENYERVLHMDEGRLTRNFTYRTKTGKRIFFQFERFASMCERNLICLSVKIRTEQDCKIRIESVLDAEIQETNNRKAEMGSEQSGIYSLREISRKGNYLVAENQTNRSKFSVQTCFADNLPEEPSCTETAEGSRIFRTVERELKAGENLYYERMVTYTTSLDGENFREEGIRVLDSAWNRGYTVAKEEQNHAWRRIWEKSDVELPDNLSLQQAVRYAIFMLYQSVGRDGKTNISANGLTGTGYMGHTFWDTEIFMFPLFLFTSPEIAKNLLMYRYGILDQARKRAEQMEDQGALYAWNSINGEECGHVFEAATAQYHINCDIFYAIRNYVQVTGDREFLVKYGAEILFEITKCLSHRGNFIPLKGNRFCINVVCGPDEYSPAVDNNLYTNMLAKLQFTYAADLADQLKGDHPEKFAELCVRCELDEKEIERWRQAAERMYLPYHEGLDIYMQDDQFLYRDPIDLESIPESRLPLLTHLHPLNLWRYQVAKQADIVLLTVLLKKLFAPEMRRKIFDFYEPKTIHDSSLSAGIHAIAACDIGYLDEAYGYFRQTARMDLDNVNRNTFFGIHSACMGATYMVVLYGYAGFTSDDGKFCFAPKYDSRIGRYSFLLRLGDCSLRVRVEENKVVYRLEEGSKLKFRHFNREILLSEGGETIQRFSEETV